MDERDEIAIAILPAIYAEYFSGCRDHGVDEHYREGLALDAYLMADAMISMRSVKIGGGNDVPGFENTPKFPSVRK